MPARARRLAAIALLGALAACAPAGLDRQQQEAEARECASLLERHVARRTPTGRIVLDGEVLDLGNDPAGFFRALTAKRGPDDFPLSGGKADVQTRASFVSDLCKAKDASSSRSAPGSGTTTTSTTTTTTAPPSGSNPG